MAIISFSVFKEKILNGIKPHTIREKKTPPEIAENLYLWWKPRTDEKEFLGVTVCTQVDSILINPATRLVIVNDQHLDNLQKHVLARSDGFDSMNDFWDFFNKQTTGYLIHWNPKFISRSQLRPEVVKHAQLSSDVVQSSKSYRPSNGTESMDFIGQWCEMCDRDKDKTKGCWILMQALVDGSTPFWIQHENNPICTSFIPCNGALNTTSKNRSQERKGQLNLLN